MQEIIEKLKAAGQEQLLNFQSELNDEQKKNLLAQIENIDFDYINGLVKSHVQQKPETKIPSDLSPAPFFPAAPKDAEQSKLYEEAKTKGVELLKAGKVAALTVAGGQGTRLGFDGPKGTFPITPIKNKTLFQYFAESILRANKKYGCEIQWFIMTSLLNDKTTQEFFKDNNYFGLNPSSVMFFTQGTMPCIGYDGKILLASKDSLALAPDGHGGTLLALKISGALDKMKASGIELISYFQVDNPLVSIANPLFLGLHCLEKSEMSAIMLSKTGPYEKLGNFCVSNGRLEIIEYSDLPNHLAEARNEDGSLQFIAGSPAIHVISREFVEKLTATGKLDLPWHRADKKVPFIDSEGNEVSPDSPNAVKLESFIFDALPLASKTMVLEARREEEFAPTKNPTGVDSVESCREMLIERDIKRLEKAGVEIPQKEDGSPDCSIELSPKTFLDDEDAIKYAETHKIEIKCGEEFYLE
jgi:UDP-N-acetylglucosamine/UDP-N-acetylgalactosamine diphosphorylase